MAVRFSSSVAHGPGWECTLRLMPTSRQTWMIAAYCSLSLTAVSPGKCAYRPSTATRWSISGAAVRIVATRNSGSSSNHESNPMTLGLADIVLRFVAKRLAHRSYPLPRQGDIPVAAGSVMPTDLQDGVLRVPETDAHVEPAGVHVDPGPMSEVVSFASTHKDRLTVRWTRRPVRPIGSVAVFGRMSQRAPENVLMAVAVASRAADDRLGEGPSAGDVLVVAGLRGGVHVRPRRDGPTRKEAVLTEEVAQLGPAAVDDVGALISGPFGRAGGWQRCVDVDRAEVAPRNLLEVLEEQVLDDV